MTYEHSLFANCHNCHCRRYWALQYRPWKCRPPKMTGLILGPSKVHGQRTWPFQTFLAMDTDPDYSRMRPPDCGHWLKFRSGTWRTCKTDFWGKSITRGPYHLAWSESESMDKSAQPGRPCSSDPNGCICPNLKSSKKSCLQSTSSGFSST